MPLAVRAADPGTGSDEPGPPGWVSSLPAGRLVLQTAVPAALPTLLGPAPPAKIAGVEVLGLTSANAEALAGLETWAEGLPLDLLLAHPGPSAPPEELLRQAALLYRCTGLLAGHPVQVSIPLVPGLARAVKLALALGFAVRLRGPPAPAALPEARTALSAWLHDPTVTAPVEPFQGLLIAMLHDQTVTLWTLLEADPRQVRRLVGPGPLPADPAPLPDAAQVKALLAAEPCRACPWREPCAGWFQWPAPGGDCREARLLFQDLAAAALALRTDLAAHGQGSGRGAGP